jgi:hypothetical protein
MIPKSGRRFSGKIMLKQQAKAKTPNQPKNHFALARRRGGLLALAPRFISP